MIGTVSSFLMPPCYHTGFWKSFKTPPTHIIFQCFRFLNLGFPCQRDTFCIDSWDFYVYCLKTLSNSFNSLKTHYYKLSILRYSCFYTQPPFRFSHPLLHYYIRIQISLFQYFNEQLFVVVCSKYIK